MCILVAVKVRMHGRSARALYDHGQSSPTDKIEENTGLVASYGNI